MNAALLDTDTLSEILKRRNLAVGRRAAAYLEEHGGYTFSEFTWFEVVRGLQEKKALRQIESFGNFSKTLLYQAN